MSQLEFGYKVTEMVWCMRFGENVDKLIFRRKQKLQDALMLGAKNELPN